MLRWHDTDTHFSWSQPFYWRPNGIGSWYLPEILGGEKFVARLCQNDTDIILADAKLPIGFLMASVIDTNLR
jgi:hypothetical protein